MKNSNKEGYFKLLNDIMRRFCMSMKRGEILRDEYSFLSDQEMHARLCDIISTLNGTEQNVIKLYYGLDSDSCVQMSTIAKSIGCSAENVRKTKENAINKLSSPSRFQNLLHEKIKLQTLEHLELSLRAYNCVKRAGIKTIQELIDTVDNETEKLQNTKNCGLVVLREITEKVQEIRAAQ